MSVAFEQETCFDVLFEAYFTEECLFFNFVQQLTILITLWALRRLH